ncbi:hypothetical protein ACFP2T_35865 [Plantactinospora solaniradicis]|uniref:Uncharacterized protein n=1 Tax=Plantactinospora solaniradicis TaxID=1723736 RepID=A0ABW1KM30_9ACTN
MFNPFSEKTMPPGLVAELDQHKATVREHTDSLILLFAEMLKGDPATSQDTWAVLMEVTMQPGQIAVLAAELLFREARAKAATL